MDMNSIDIQLLDWIVIVGYISLIFFLAYRARRSVHAEASEESAKEQYLANKSLTFWESLCSIIATEVSALTFLGIPAFAFNTDFSFVQIYMGATIGRIFIARLFLPRIYDQGLTIYEVMAKDTGLPSGQRLVATFYTLSKILIVGVRLFSGSILVSQFIGVNVYLGLTALTFITFLYTLVGGLKAVVRTDMLQMLLFISGGLLAHYLIPQTSGESWSNMMAMAHASGKTNFLDFSNPTPFLLGVFGGILFDMATHGVDQDYAQRMMANKTLRGGQLAIFLSSFFSISVGFLFLGVGALLWAHYQTQPLPTTVANADHLFAYFIVNYFPVGIRGIMVAGVMAATMSTLDSTINALCACVYNDIFPNRKAHKMKFYAFIDTICITFLLYVIAVLSSTNDGLLLLGLKAQSWTAGSLLGLFMAKVVFRQHFPFRLTPTSVVGAYLIGTAGVFVNSQILEWNWNLNVYWSCGLSMIFLWFYARLRPAIPAKT
jgi:solute:Na+ symporter, SSS family